MRFKLTPVKLLQNCFGAASEDNKQILSFQKKKKKSFLLNYNREVAMSNHSTNKAIISPHSTAFKIKNSLDKQQKETHGAEIK